MKKTTLCKNFIVPLLLLLALSVRGQNTALNFDGTSNQYIETSPMVPLTGSFTVMGWVYARANHTQIFTWGSPNVNKYIQIKTNFNGTFQIYAASGVINLYSTTSILNGWHHVAVTNNAGTVNVYVDGVNEGTASANFSSITPTRTTLGSALLNGTIQGSGNYDIDEISIWNTALSGAQVSTYMSTPPVGSETGLVLAYNFNPTGVVPAGDNTTLTTISDLSGTYNGNLTGFTLNGATSNYINSTNPTLEIDENILKQEFYLYPNPAKNYISINYVNNIVVKKINLYNKLGALVKVFDASKKQFDISNISVGFYLLEIESNKGKISYKIIKE